MRATGVLAMLVAMLVWIGCSSSTTAPPCQTVNGSCVVVPMAPLAAASCSDIASQCTTAVPATPNLACLTTPPPPSTTSRVALVATVEPLYTASDLLTAEVSVSAQGGVVATANVVVGTEFVINSLPTDTALEITVGRRTTSEVIGQPPPPSVWVPTSTFGVRLSTAGRACQSASDSDCLDTAAGAARWRQSLLVATPNDLVMVPALAGQPGGVSNGFLVLGRVVDCDGVRLANAGALFSKAQTVSSDTSPPRPLNRVSYLIGTSGIAPGPALLGTSVLGELIATLDALPAPLTLTTYGRVHAGDAEATLLASSPFTPRVGGVSIVEIRPVPMAP